MTIEQMGTSMRDHQKKAARALFKIRGIQPQCQRCGRPCKVLRARGPGESSFRCFIAIPKRKRK